MKELGSQADFDQKFFHPDAQFWLWPGIGTKGRRKESLVF